MTPEQKAKAYNKVVNKLRRFMEQGVDPLITRADVQDFFPELVESEDEGIRKAIGYAIGQSTHSDGTLINGVSSEEALAWLEKQEEHANFRNKIQVGDKVTRNEDGVLVNLSQLKRIAKPAEEYNITGIGSKHAEGKLAEKIKELNDTLEKQSKQKSADKVEPKFKVGQTIKKEDFNSGFTIVKLEDGFYYNDMGDHFPFTDQAHWELVEQKPAWSEEDEEIWNKAKQIFPESLNMQSGYVTGCIDTFKHFSLKKEWSEDDMKVIKEIIFLLKHHNSNETLTTVHSIEDMINWLKSLRPQNTWKPSEGDIIILEKVIKGELEPKVFEATLQGILEQLKKLKKE